MHEEKELTSQFRFFFNTYGLPDSEVLGTSGKPQEGVLRGKLELSRSQGRTVAAGMRSNLAQLETKMFEPRHVFMNVICDPAFRASIAESTFEDLLARNSESLSGKAPAAFGSTGKKQTASALYAWELLAIYDYAPEAWGLTYSEIEMEACPELCPRYDDLGDQFPGIIDATCSKLEADMQNWDKIPRVKQEQLANIVFATGMIADPDYITGHIESHPGLADFYSNIMASPYNQELSTPMCDVMEPEEIEAAVAPAASATAFACKSPEDFYEHMGALVAQAKKSPRDPSVAPVLLQMAQELHEWFEQNPQTKSVEECASRMIGALYAMGHDAGLEGFAEEVPASNYRSYWNAFLGSNPAKEIQEDVLVARLTASEELVDRQRASIETSKRNVADLRQQLKDLTQQEPEGRRAQREMEEQQQELTTQYTERKNRLYEVEDEAILSLLPPGSSIDDLEEHAVVDVPEEDAVSPAMKVALQRVNSYLESGFVASFGEHVNVDDPAQPASDLEAEDWDEEDELEAALEAEMPEVTSDPEPEPEPLIEDPSPQLKAEAKGEAESDVPAEVPADEVAQEVDPEPEPEMEVVAAEVETETPAKIEVREPTALEIDCLHQINEDGVIDAGVANTAILELARQNRLEEAHSLSVLLDDKQYAHDIVPANLLRAAFYGGNNWEFSQNLTKSQKLVNNITPAQIDQWGHIQEAGKSVPYLVLAACFQASVFGGNYSNAPFLLSSIRQAFDGPLSRLLEDTINLANRDKVATLGNLRAGGKGKKDDEDNDYGQKALTWCDKLKKTKRGYTPILKAQVYCVDHGVFHDVVKAIVDNKPAGADVVKQFAGTYSQQLESKELLNESLIAVGYGSRVGGITARAMSRYHAKVNELVDIAQSWLAHISEKSGELEDYSKRFPTIVPQVITQLDAQASDEAVPADRRAGAAVALSMFKNMNSVIEGNDRAIWDYSRAKAWLHYPESAARIGGADSGGLKQLSWHLSQVDAPMLHEDLLPAAVDEQDTALAYLMYLCLRDQGDDRKRTAATLKEKFADHRLSLLHRCTRLESQIENMVLSLLINPDRAETILSDIEDQRDAIYSLEQYTHTSRIQGDLTAIEDEISKKIASKLREMESLYREELEAIQDSMPGEPVPQKWIETMDAAIAEANLPVIDEMLDELQTARKDNHKIKAPSIIHPALLKDFIEVEKEVYGHIKKSTNGKDMWKEISSSKESCFGLNFEHQNSNFRKVIEAIASWNSIAPPRQVGQDFGSLYDKVGSVLNFMGLTLVDSAYKRNQAAAIDYRVNEHFAALYMKVKTAETGRPFPIFGGVGGSESQPVIIAFKAWTPQQLERYMDSIGMVGAKPILISGVPMSQTQRETFAHYFKAGKSTILHIDMTMALFLGSSASNADESSAVRKFLWLTLPWTYFNPYVGGDTTYPPPRAMRFGRQTEINRLLEMNNGHAIVFGGRQLGKSTIVQEVRSNFHKPEQKQFAFYHLLDKNMDRMGITQQHWDNARELVWRSMYNDLVARDLIKKNDPKLDADGMAHAVESALIANKEHKIIVIFDEIDPILNVDSAHDFGIFRGIRELVSKPEIQGRFKLIIAGLENVKRFENSPNNPLQQLGGSLQVSIMSTQDALHLIQEPLLAAGYAFENPQVASRILSVTNRHPGLIQIFCHELIAYPASSSEGNVGDQFIRDYDVTAVSQKQDVIDLIRKRFDMTLVLDRRYLIIVYGLLAQKKGTRPFSPKEAHEIAKGWLPEEFAQLGVKQFEAFLEELCGLGVLKALREGRTIQYVLRNTNIQKLIGEDEDEIAERLLMAIAQRTQSSPLDRHAVWKDKVESCPITFRDEQELLGGEIRQDDDSEVKNLDSWKYTTTIVVGSDALGLHALKDTLPQLYEIECLNHSELKKRDKYTAITRPDDHFSSPEKFRTLLHGIVDKKADTDPYMIIIEVGGSQPLAHLLGLLDAAHAMTGMSMEKKFPVRVVFVLSPKAYWQWLSAPELTMGREDLQPFINLSPWGHSASAHLLEKLGMINDDTSVADLVEHTEGWHMAIDGLCKIKRAHPGTSALSDIADKFPPITVVKGRSLKEFRKASGVDDVGWVVPLLKASIELWEKEEFSAEEIMMAALDMDVFDGADVEIDTAMSWLSSMNILRKARQGKKEDATYRISPSILHAIGLLNEQ